MVIIERSEEDVRNETMELYNKIKPLLDEGYSVNKSVRIIKNKNSINTKLGWYQRLKEYVDNIEEC